MEVKFDIRESLQFKNVMHLVQLNISSGWKRQWEKEGYFYPQAAATGIIAVVTKILPI